MVTLKIDLQEGFSNDTVTVEVDGQTVLEREDVSTDYAVGLAVAADGLPASIETEVEPGPHRIEVTLPLKQISATREVTVAEPLFVSVSVDEDRIEIRESQQSFRYF